MPIDVQQTPKRPGTHEVQRLLMDAEMAPSYDLALKRVTEAVLTQLLGAMKHARTRLRPKEIGKPDKYIEALSAIGLDQLLVEGWCRGKITYRQVDQHVNRLREAIQARTLTPSAIKLGILAFDGTAQRLASVSAEAGGFEYPLERNQARDSLVTFARALHR